MSYPSSLTFTSLIVLLTAFHSDIAQANPENIFFTAINYTKPQVEVLKISQGLANKLVRSQCFRNFMMKRKLVDTNDLTNNEIVNKLITTPIMTPVKMYYSRKSVIGYRDPPNPTIYTNRRYHEGATACARASNLTHEWSHVAGFKHDFKRTKSRPFSVPYSINDAFLKCCSCKGIKDCKVKE